MPRNGSRTAAPAFNLRALVPLTSRAEEDRYWYDPGESLTGGVSGAYRFDRFEDAKVGVDIAWSCGDRRSGH